MLCDNDTLEVKIDYLIGSESKDFKFFSLLDNFVIHTQFTNFTIYILNLTTLKKHTKKLFLLLYNFHTHSFLYFRSYYAIIMIDYKHFYDPLKTEKENENENFLAQKIK